MDVFFTEDDKFLKVSADIRKEFDRVSLPKRIIENQNKNSW